MSLKNVKTFPLWGVRPDLSCACGNPACKSIGKHPSNLAPHGFKDARVGWDPPPGYNTGIVTGEGFSVLDIDPRNGGTVPDWATPTYAVRTGGGGFHFYYAGSVPSHVISPGLEVKGIGGYVAGPGSRHMSGQTYEVVDDSELAPMPAEMQLKRSTPPAAAWDGRSDAAETTLGKAFAGRGWLGERLADGKRAVRCPWHETHSDGRGDGKDSSTVLFHDGKFHCSHAHCSELNTRKVSNIMGLNELRKTEEGRVVKCAENLQVLMSQESCRYDRFTEKLLLDGEIAQAPHAFGLAAKFSKAHLVEFSTSEVWNALVHTAMQNRFSSVVEWLDGLEWDNYRRLDTFGRNAIKTETPIVNAIMRVVVLGMVWRAYRPGWKFDYVLQLVGSQGTRKSTFVRDLASPAWFCDSPADTRRQLSEQRIGAWLYEDAEGIILDRFDPNVMKALLSGATDNYREAYGKQAMAHEISTVFAITTNDLTCLKDPTGSRRNLVIGFDGYEREWFLANRDQIFAEAVQRYRGGDEPVLAPAEDAARASVNSAYEAPDVIQEALEDSLMVKSGKPLKMVEIQRFLTNEGVCRESDHTRKRIALALRALGYDNKPVNGKRLWRKTFAKSA